MRLKGLLELILLTHERAAEEAKVLGGLERFKWKIIKTKWGLAEYVKEV